MATGHDYNPQKTNAASNATRITSIYVAGKRFHYDRKLAGRTLTEIATEHPNTMASLTMGNDALDWYFEPGALVRDRLGVREIFQIPKGANVQEEVDRILIALHRISDTFGRFAGNFIWQTTSP